MSKLSALSRHETLVLERRLLRAIGAKARPSFKKPENPKEAPRNELARKLKEIGLRTV